MNRRNNVIRAVCVCNLQQHPGRGEEEGDRWLFHATNIHIEGYKTMHIKRDKAFSRIFSQGSSVANFMGNH